MRAAAALGPKTATPEVAQLVRDPGDERRLGPDDDEIGLERAGEPEQAFAVLGADGMAAAERRRCRGCPGAACSSSRSGAWLSFHASACSRPPDPTRSTFTRGL